MDTSTASTEIYATVYDNTQTDPPATETVVPDGWYDDVLAYQQASLYTDIFLFGTLLVVLGVQLAHTFIDRLR